MTSGRPVRVRAAHWEDAQRVRDFVAALSFKSQVMRFFTGLARLPDSMVRSMVTVNEQRDTLVAVYDGEIIGHAMSYRGTAADVEIAVVVADAWQGLGLGTHLIRSLVRRAAADGATTVSMDVMGENRRMLAIVHRLWPEARMRIESGSVEITAGLLECFFPCEEIASSEA